MSVRRPGQGWARIVNNNYVPTVGNRLVPFPVYEKPWHVLYVLPGLGHQPRQCEQFYTYDQAVAFVRNKKDR